MAKTLCFYHSADLDGHCSGALVKFHDPNVELIGIDYGDDFPWDKIEKGDKVYMVDFCLQPFGDMLRLNSRCDLVWIDHHKSAIEEQKKQHITIKGVRTTNKAACELTNEWIFGKNQIHPVVELLGRYDIWDQSDKELWDTGILPFQKGFKEEFLVTDPVKNFQMWFNIFSWHDFDKGDMNRIVELGLKSIERAKIQNAAYIKKYAYETKFEGFNCVVVNKGMTGSQLFDSVWDEIRYGMMITYIHSQGKFFTVSLYSTRNDVDCSVIAKQYGGGGHKGAAGFQIESLPFEFVSEGPTHV